METNGKIGGDEGTVSKIHETLHRLVDVLPEREAFLAKRLLEVLLDEAEEDIEPLSPEQQAALERGREQAARGETIRLEELEKELDREL